MDRFASDDLAIPPRLRNRIESWIKRQPKTQFQQYGPLNAYFSIKFISWSNSYFWQGRGSWHGFRLTLTVSFSVCYILVDKLKTVTLDVFVDIEERNYPDFVIITAYTGTPDPQDDKGC